MTENDRKRIYLANETAQNARQNPTTGIKRGKLKKQYCYANSNFVENI